MKVSYGKKMAITHQDILNISQSIAKLPHKHKMAATFNNKINLIVLLTCPTLDVINISQSIANLSHKHEMAAK